MTVRFMPIAVVPADAEVDLARVHRLRPAHRARRGIHADHREEQAWH